MKPPIHDLSDKYVISNILGYETHFSGEIVAWNSISLIILSIASLMVLVNRLKDDNDSHNRLIKLLFGSLAVVALAGVFYPIELGLIGLNIISTIILVVDFFKYDKFRKR